MLEPRLSNFPFKKFPFPSSPLKLNVLLNWEVACKEKRVWMYHSKKTIYYIYIYSGRPGNEKKIPCTYRSGKCEIFADEEINVPNMERERNIKQAYKVGRWGE